MNVTKGSPEKRELERVNFLCECEIESDALGGVKNARINDLNCGGAFIDVMIPFPMGAVLGLRFRLRGTEIRVKAEVRYTMRNIGVGVRFLDLSDEARDLIENVLYNRPMPPRPAVPPPPELPANEVWPPADQLAVPDLKPEAATARPAVPLATPAVGAAPAVPNPRPPVVAPKAPVPAPKPVAPAQSDVVMSGNLSILSVFDIINMIQSGRLTGALIIITPNGTGNIYFNSGRIVDADHPNDRGVTALNALVGATCGTFAFKKSQTPFEETISSVSNTALLLEMMVSRDSGTCQPGVLIN